MHSCLARRWCRRCGRRRSRRTRTWALPASLVLPLPVDTAFGRMCSDLLSASPRALGTARGSWILRGDRCAAAPRGGTRGRRRPHLQAINGRAPWSLVSPPAPTICCVMPLLMSASSSSVICIRTHMLLLLDRRSPFPIRFMMMTTLSALEYRVFLFILSIHTLYIFD